MRQKRLGEIRESLVIEDFNKEPGWVAKGQVKKKIFPEKRLNCVSSTVTFGVLFQKAD